ncbi:hypothetical protein NC651_003979 [Populus alba x Populus x berolinensis]|nr:hypothetical protein NC651_003979 [Populus alba x Populus x berolinensis]
MGLIVSKVLTVLGMGLYSLFLGLERRMFH